MKTGEAKSRSGATSQLGVHRHTVADWIGLSEEEGIEKIQEVGDPGPDLDQGSIPPEVMEALKKRFCEPEGFVSYKEIQCYLAEDQGVELSYSTVHGFVRYEIGVKPKAPRPSHPKKPAGTNRLPGVPSRPSRGRRDRANQSVRLLCQGERRVRLIPITRHRITLPSLRPNQEPKPGYE